MVKVNFSSTDYQRKVANEADLILKNRYFEQNPSLSDDGAALLARPGLRKLTTVGSGPIRGMGSEPGSFNGDLFFASGQEFYRMDNALNATSVYGDLANPERGVVSIAITGAIGDVPEYAFIADGANLFVYMANGYARNSLSGSPANNDVLQIGTMYYKWTNGSVDTGTPAGTSGSPWLVALGATDILSYAAMFYAINASGTAGTDYSTALVQNPDVISDAYSSTILSVRANVAGAAGNTIITTETGAAIAWSHPGTLSQGGSPTFSKVMMPEDDVGCIDVAVINSYVIVIPTQGPGYTGVFYYIEPGETTVNPLNFYTAERSPDAVYGVQVFGDQFWLPGESTTEVWYVTGVQDNPLARLQGIVLDRGSWQNTSKAIHEQMIVVDADGGVFLVQGGSPTRISSPGIEEEIRIAISAQQSNLYD